MLEVIKRKKEIEEFLYDEKTRTYCRLNNEKTFIRNRKITFTDLLLITLNNKSKTTTMELRDYEIYAKGNDKVNYTEEAYLKQRRHLNPLVFKKANMVFTNSFYNDSNDAKKFKNYLLMGIDGIKHEVPNTPQNREYFGTSINQHKKQPARASSSTMFDLENHFYVDIQLQKYNFSEKSMAKAHIEEALKILKDDEFIVVLDRNYISLEFLLWLDEKEIKYVFRLGKDKYKKEINAMKTDDEFVDIIHTYARLQNIRETYPEQAEKLKKLEKTTVRITKKKINGNKKIILLSNLNMEEFNSNEIMEIYSKRWNIESSYDCMKNKLCVECFTGNLPIIVEQDLYAQILIYNQIQDMINESNERIRIKNQDKNLKLEYKVNENKAVGLFKEKFIKIILIQDDIKSALEYDKLMDEMTKYVSAMRPNRPSNPRNFNRANKNKTNMKLSY